MINLDDHSTLIAVIGTSVGAVMFARMLAKMWHAPHEKNN